MRRLLVFLLASLALPAFAAPASAKWSRLSSEHFEFVGDASERELRGIAERLERFRQALGRFFYDQPTNQPRTIVVVFQNGRSFTPFKPTFHGKTVDVVGYFTATEDGNYIAVNAEEEDNARAVLFHEYAHFLIRHSIGEVPVWANEGLAGFYQTFESRDGRSATLGLPNDEHVSLLRAGAQWLPFKQLIAIDRDSPLYNEGDRRTMLYAESWALIHYLTVGGSSRAGQLQLYLSAIQQGLRGEAAFEVAFGDVEALEREVRDYVQWLPTRGVRLTLEEQAVSVSTSPIESIGNEEAAGYLGEMLAFSGRVDDARVFLQNAIEVDTPPSKATAALGLLEFRAERDTAAFPLLESAASAFPDAPAVQRLYGQLLSRRAHQGGPDSAALMSKAVTALTRAFEMEPRNMATVVALIEAEGGNAASVSLATTMLRKAVDAAPGREEFRLVLGQALIEQGDYAAAARYLGPVLARPSTPEVRESARRLLARIANASNVAQRDAR